MGVLFVLAVIAAGFASGILSGMFGVGGAVLTTPGVRFLGATPIEAVGSTLPAILPGALSGAWHYRRAGLIDWQIALTTGVAGSVFAVGGAELSDHINAHYLMIFTAALLLYSGLRNIGAEKSAPARVAVPIGALTADSLTADGPAVDARPEFDDVNDGGRRSVLAILLVGAASGALAGLLGVGGGLLLIPGYTVLLRLSAKRAVATSLVAVAMFSVPAMLTHALLGHINWTFAGLLMAGVVPGARLGARITLTGSEARLRLLMGLFFTLLALVYGGAELAAL
jgi:uncharacterized membrane protein YfcA